MAEQNTKSFMARPEGKVGTFFSTALLVAGGGATLYYWALILPFLITMAANTLTLAALCGVIGLICVAVIDKRWRNLIAYGYKSFWRFITGVVIELDPIGQMRNFIDKLKSYTEDIDTAMESVRGSIEKLARQIAESESEKDHELKLASQAQKDPNLKSQVVLHSRQASRLAESNATLIPELEKAKVGLTRLVKVREHCDLTILDLQQTVKLKSSERALLLANHKAWSAIRKVMADGGDEREMFDRSIEFLNDDYAKKMGEIEQIVSATKSRMESQDLEKGILDDGALKLLDDWNAKNNPTGAPLRVAAPLSGVRVADLPVGDFDDLFSSEGGEEQRKRPVNKYT